MMRMKESHILELKKLSLSNEKQMKEMSELYKRREKRMQEKISVLERNAAVNASTSSEMQIVKEFS